MSTENVPVYKRYLGNGTATEFSVSFPYLDKKYVKVYLKRKDSLSEELLSPDRYRFLNDTTVEFPITLSDAVLSEGDVLTIQRETELGSNFEFDNQRRLFPVEAMNADDLGFQQIQELARDVNRSIKVPNTSDETPEDLWDKFNQGVIDTANNAAISLEAAERAEAGATHVDEVVAGFDAHVAESTDNFNTNYNDKLVAFNINAQTMTDGYNTNAMLKIDDFDAHYAIKEMEFDDHAAIKQGEVDTSANNANVSELKAKASELNSAESERKARVWAEGTDPEVVEIGGEHSSEGWADISKYWAGQSASGSIQPDWNQIDTTAKDYIKNKPDVMTIDTDQEVSSSKTFMQDQAIKSPDLDIRTDRSKRGNGLIFTDKNGTQTAGIGVYVNNNQSPECRLVASNGTQSAFAGLGVTTDGQGFFEVPTPKDGSNNRDAVNSEWVHRELTTHYVDKKGDTMIGALNFGTSGYIEANKSNSTKGLALFGSIDGYGQGASIALRDNTADGSQAGVFKLETGNNVTGHTHTLQGNPDGTVTWDTKELANVDLDNISQTGKDVINPCIDLTAGVNITSPYTFPKAGVVISIAQGSTASSDAFVSLKVFSGEAEVFQLANRSIGTGQNVYACVVSPILEKDTKVTIMGNNIKRNLFYPIKGDF